MGTDLVLTGEYRGWKVHQTLDRCYAERDGYETLHTDTLEKMRKKIDAAMRTDFKRVNIICHGWRAWERGVLTSITTEDGKRYGWVTKTNGRREKQPLTSIFLDDEANSLRLNEIHHKRQEIESIQEEITQIEAQMERYQPE